MYDISKATTRAACAELDAHDPLAHFRHEFDLPEGVIYLDGNSLGAVPRRAKTRLAQVIHDEWGNGLIRSWNNAGWMDMPERIGAKIAQLVGAHANEVVVADSTSINLYKVLNAALSLNPNRKTILSQHDNFPTDLYMAQGLAAQLGNQHELKFVDPQSLVAHLSDKVAVVMLTHVNYRTGEMHDMQKLTQAAHDCGALVIWDLAHTAGAMPVDLNACRADFAVGCGYKYLNGGPGAPAFVFMAQRHFGKAQQPLAGWMGHAQPFAFDSTYAPAPGITQMLCGSPAVLSMSALECGINVMLEADMHTLRQKSVALTDLFIELIQAHASNLNLITPKESSLRGSQVSFTHPHGYPIVQALIAQNIIGDFRAPNVLRFGFAPLYNQFVDVWDAAQALLKIIETESWNAPAFMQKRKVT